MNSALISAVRGMRDILPEQIGAWQRLEKTAATCFHSYGYRELRTPLVEQLELFTRQIGETTDVVQKEMYRFTDAANGEQVALRPEATVSTVRALLAAGKQRGGTVRVWYGGPMFRHERPQKGRYRQFHQLGAEALGSSDPTLDAEQIIMLARLWQVLGVHDKLRLDINNLGNRRERACHREKLTAYFQKHREALDEDARQRIESNPLRILDSKNPVTLEIAANAPALADELGADSQRHAEQVKEKLTAANVAFNENAHLVRGLDYYNLTVYEWSLADDGRRQNTVCGGGRYDGLAENIGGDAFPGCGFALGMERIIDILPPEAPAALADCFVALTDSGTAATAVADRIAEDCRDRGLAVWRHVGGGNIGKQIKKADTMGIPLVIIIGADEIEGDYITVKRLLDGKQQQTAVNDAAIVSRRLLDA
ncbi:MAG: histidine--tRNA ligase [Proteobacteria bacterium]|nr:histidine--tRNA ligase [Pseudomonadota bacterium]MCH9758908.1 histidine--tRNA ligase [Pseudomonadota bacterium]